MATPAALAERMPRLDALTGMRWWAAFFVFCYHMLVFAPLPPVAAGLFEYGYMGVTFFFVLSGFVLTWSASPAVSQSTFYWRRFARIYPSHFVALLLAIPVFYRLAPDPGQPWVKPFSVGILALSFLLLNGWWRDPVILFSGNPAAWTLTCEAFFYAAHPYLSKVLYRFSGKRAAWLAVAVGGIAVGFRAFARHSPDNPLALAPQPPVRISEFAAGMALAWALRTGWRPRVPVSVGLATLGLALALIVGVPRKAPGSRAAALLEGYSGEIMGIACAVAILSVALAALQGKRSLFASRWQVRLGEYSYAFYLLHATVMYAVLSVLGGKGASWFNLVWYAALLTLGVCAAAALHHFVEKPMEARMRAWKDRRSVSAPVSA